MAHSALFRLIAAAFYFAWSAVAIVGSLIAWRQEPSALTVVPIIVSYACLAVLVLVGGPARLLIDRHVRRRALGAELQPCRKCGHSLIGLPRFARCPECGTAHDTRKLRDFWSRALRVTGRTTMAQHIWTCAGFVAACALLVAVGLVLANTGAGDFGKPLIPLVLVLPAFCITPLRAWFRRRLIRSRFTLCRRCGLNLSQQASTGACALCRKAFSRRAMQRQWRSDYPADWNRDVLVTSQRAERLISMD